MQQQKKLNKKLNKETINTILDQIYNGEIPERFEEAMKNKNKPENLSYEEELLLKHSLPVAYVLYLLTALGYCALGFVIIAFIVCVGMLWYGYIPHLINMFLFERFPEIYAGGLDVDHYFDNGVFFVAVLWAIKDFCLWLLYQNLVENLDRVKKIKEESEKLFDD